jgi:hypothetical protein
MSKFGVLTALAATLLCAGCSEMQQPAMTQAQADVYNQCMSTHWSSLADSALFGVAGYEYHQNQVLNCQQVALTPRQPAPDQAVSQPTSTASAKTN